MDIEKILTYLSDLEIHNEREWYHANKKLYQEANAEFEELLQQMIFKIGKRDSSVLHNNPKDLTFKIVRDTRFSHDKSPYNPAFRAHISSLGKLPIPVGYYIKIQPGNRSFLGGGLFGDMFKDATAMIRDYIVDHGDEWQQIISDKSFSDLFSVKGVRLKNVPRGYDGNHPQAEFLKNKSWYLEYKMLDKQLHDGDEFINTAVDLFLQMRPFNEYLNKALYGFKFPER